MELAIHHEGDFDAGAFVAGAFDAGAFAKAELDRVACDLAEHREPAREDVAGASLASLVAARDAQLWAAINSGGPALE